MPSKRAESVFPHQTAEMQANLLLRREDSFSHVPCTRDFAKFLNEMHDPLGFQTAVLDVLARFAFLGAACQLE
jgi:hypothetical protein